MGRGGGRGGVTVVARAATTTLCDGKGSGGGGGPANKSCGGRVDAEVDAAVAAARDEILWEGSFVDVRGHDCVYQPSA